MLTARTNLQQERLPTALDLTTVTLIIFEVREDRESNDVFTSFLFTKHLIVGSCTNHVLCLHE